MPLISWIHPAGSEKEEFKTDIYRKSFRKRKTIKVIKNNRKFKSFGNRTTLGAFKTSRYER
jgi:hypothetical protein